MFHFSVLLFSVTQLMHNPFPSSIQYLDRKLRERAFLLKLKVLAQG